MKSSLRQNVEPQEGEKVEPQEEERNKKERLSRTQATKIEKRLSRMQATEIEKRLSKTQATEFLKAKFKNEFEFLKAEQQAQQTVLATYQQQPKKTQMKGGSSFASKYQPPSFEEECPAAKEGFDKIHYDETTGAFHPLSAAIDCKIYCSVKRRSRADAADLVFFNSVRGTPWCLDPDDAVREPRIPTQFDVGPASVELPPKIAAAQITPDRAGYTSVRQWNWRGMVITPTTQAVRHLRQESLDL